VVPWAKSGSPSDAARQVITTVNRTAILAWTGRQAYFALEPKEISNDKKRLTVKFFWLPRYQYSPKVDILNSPSIPEDLDGLNHGVGLWNLYTNKQIRSGDEIYLETDDPERLPLPDLRILEMQWILHRVTALSGAAEPRDDFGEDADDD
jgi:hypothetical protein